jgi:nitrogen fixation NifU-like protein
MENRLYKEELLEHYRHPRNYGELTGEAIVSQSLNPSCGDQVSIYLKIDGAQLMAVGFTGKGCVISQAAASMLTEKMKGQRLEDIMKLDTAAMLSLVGIPLGPTRLRCALLSLEALHQAVEQAKGGSHA